MIFGTTATLKKFENVNVGYDSEFLDRTYKFEYLGIFIDLKLSFNDHVTHIRSKVIRLIKMLDKLKFTLNLNTKLILNKTLIMPLFDYGIIFDC